MATDLVDWGLAAKIARLSAGRETWAKTYHFDSLRAELSELAEIADAAVHDVSGLVRRAPTSPLIVASRSVWAEATIDSFHRQLRTLEERLPRPLTPGLGLSQAVGALELGGLIGLLSGRVLGQYDPFDSSDEGSRHGQIIYVGSNLIALEQRLGVNPRDLRMWVTAHETTHKAQFTSPDWVRGFYREQIQTLMGSVTVDLKGFLDRLRSLNQTVRDHGVLQGVSTLGMATEGVAAMSRLQSLMTVLEGHADVVMAEVGKELIPSSSRLEKIFSSRRKLSGIGGLVSKLLGFEAKLLQYERGAAFVRGCEALVGREASLAIFSSPDHLPSATEISEPRKWCDRVFVGVA